jgi:hypothetical protein
MPRRGAQAATGTMDAVAGVTGQYLVTVALHGGERFEADTLYVLRVDGDGRGGVVAAAGGCVSRSRFRWGGMRRGGLKFRALRIHWMPSGADGDTLKNPQRSVDPSCAGAGSGTGHIHGHRCYGRHEPTGRRARAAFDGHREGHPVYQPTPMPSRVPVPSRPWPRNYVWFEKAGI